MSGMPLKEAAKTLRLHRSTLSKWLKQGAPCLEEGSSGRGHTARVDLEAIQRWRARKFAAGLAQRNDTELLDLMATALMDAMKRDDLQHRTKTTADQVALAVLIIYERVYRNVMQQPLEPQDVPHAMRNLCTDYLDFVERGTFQRRS